MTHSVWLEVALNGPWSRRRQPNIPVTADEIVADAMACAEAGAAIVHFHAYDPATGRQREDYDIYAPIIARIRAAADVVCYPTIPYAGSVEAPAFLTPTARFAAVEKLLQAGLIEWAGVDPGSTNLAHRAAIGTGAAGVVYANPESHIRHALELARRHGATPSYAIYEPGFLRLGAALHRAVAGTPIPVYRFMFSRDMLFGFPPTDWALEAYLHLLADEAPGAPWMVAGLGVDIEPLIDMTVARGGHVRVGLEDAPLGNAATNRALVEAARRRIEAAGGTLAGAAHVRAALKAA
ncbi:MAG: 3-keto-5-aminohexanoate cleavage protein [Alphaproteobacteria bacterium]|nr:3-keto-5-aminohexanoate cleavage protein [Alphaproteobacteria bacterium]